MRRFSEILLFLFLNLVFPSNSQEWDVYRPKFHYSVAKDWLNDPNGLVYLNGEYHMYYQYTPDSPHSGVKYWGHTISRDLVKWTDQPVAIEPDELGAVWSGSAVVDFTNSSGFQTDPEIPTIVALYTSAGEVQSQSIAYSNDLGRVFSKYEGNPVIPNPGRVDFRDPKVIFYQNSTWLMVLADGDRATFFSSPNLKEWTELSSFRVDPDHGLGVWECPDFFPLTDPSTGEELWVLLISHGWGGPNGGTATRYFIGHFNGSHFSQEVESDPLWMDSGVDNYASVSFFNEQFGRRVVIGWMTNGMYANDIPTGDWRGQMTMPRELVLAKNEVGELRLKSRVVPELLEAILVPEESFDLSFLSIAPDAILNITDQMSWSNNLLYLNLTVNVSSLSDNAALSICFMNSLSKSQEVCLGFDQGRERPFFLDRERSGYTEFNENFKRRLSSIREVEEGGSEAVLRIEAYLDLVALEVFFDNGLTSMTSLFYPNEPYNRLEIRHHSGGNINSRLGFLAGSVIRGLSGIQ